MRLVLTSGLPDQETCARWQLARATSSAEAATGICDRYEAAVRLLPGEDNGAAFDRVKRRLFAYDVFPPRVLRFALCPSGPVTLGTVVVQRVGFGRVTLESAVRVVDVWDTASDAERRVGFRYVTLAGHPERGVAAFSVSQDDAGVHVVAESRSEPGIRLARIGRPIGRRIQVAMTRAAVRRLAGGDAPAEPR